MGIVVYYYTYYSLVGSTRAYWQGSGRAAARGHFPKAVFRRGAVIRSIASSHFRTARVSCSFTANGPWKKGGHHACLGATAPNGTILRQRIRFGELLRIFILKLLSQQRIRFG